MKAFITRERKQLGQVEDVELPELADGQVAILVAWSDLNYKDALAATGHPGVASELPHVPGIDCAGVVAESRASGYAVGDPVLVTGYDLGAPAWGGWCQQVRVPAEWVVPMPATFDARHAMTLGTAGFTAAQCVAALVEGGIAADRGLVVVTGATGGVGLWSIRLLAHLGYEVVAVTGKADRSDDLRQLGATRVAGRELLATDDTRPLLKSEWAGAIDTVGGQPLAHIVRSTQHRGVVACCGLVAGTELPLTVHPFILRGVRLVGIDSSKCPREPRMEIWRKLSNEWKVSLPESWINETTLYGVGDEVTAMLAGKHAGRTLVRVE
jgi:acrylyl-CoA reductase (NADPH)